MTKYTTVSIRKNLGGLAAKRASQDALSLSAVANLLFKSYVDGKIQIGATPKLTANGFTPEFEKATLKAWADAKRGKNISGPFSSVKELLADLHLKTAR
jgi:hypothetical protein